MSTIPTNDERPVSRRTYRPKETEAATVAEPEKSWINRFRVFLRLEQAVKAWHRKAVGSRDDADLADTRLTVARREFEKDSPNANHLDLLLSEVEELLRPTPLNHPAAHQAAASVGITYPHSLAATGDAPTVPATLKPGLREALKRRTDYID